MPEWLTVVLRLIGGGALGVAVFTVRADACEFPLTDLSNGVIDAWRQRDLPPIPTNAAFVGARNDGSLATAGEPVAVAVDSSSQPIMGHVLVAIGNRPGAFVAKIDEPLSPNSVIQSAGQTLTAGDYLDEAPPSTLEILDGHVNHEDSDSGCAGGTSSCAGMTDLSVTLAAPAKDDRVPGGRVAYLVYLEKSEDAARTTRTPFALVSESGTVNATTLFVPLDASWADSDAYVSVSAIDWAGNESPRTEPHQANGGGIGCAVRLPRKHHSKLAMGFAIVSVVAWVRRSKRQR